MTDSNDPIDGTKESASGENAIRKDAPTEGNTSIDKFETATRKFREKENPSHSDRVETYVICREFLKYLDLILEEVSKDIEKIQNVPSESGKDSAGFEPLTKELGNLLDAKTYVRNFRESLFPDLLDVVSYKDIFNLLQDKLIEDFQNFLNGIPLYRYLISMSKFWKIFWSVVVSIVGIVVAGLVLRYI